jgi:outer membrane usher protein
MSIPRCVRPSDRTIQKLILVRIPSKISNKSLLCLLWIIAIMMVPYLCHASEPIIVAVFLNQEKQGDFFVHPGEHGDFLVAAADLKGMGFQRIPENQTRIEGEPYVSLKGMAGVRFTFDEKTLTLQITADPAILPEKIIDLGPIRKPGIIYPRDNSFFLNYGIDYATGGESSLGLEGFNVSNEMGFRFHDALFLTDTLYSNTPDSSRYIRLDSSLIFDRRESLRRYVAGDYSAASGSLGGNVQMGGVSISKAYGLNPYFIKYPLFDITGLLALPSEVELYLDGVKVHSERFSPGKFELKNLQSFGGAQTVEVVIRDSLGREQRIVSPFYFTDHLLRRGLQEYSYNVGFLRRDFGQQSDNYGSLAFSGFHRLGLTDTLNIGLRAEATAGLLNFGIESVFKTGTYGVVQLQGALSDYHGDTSAASLLSYDIQSRNFRATLALSNFSSGYRTLGNLKADSNYRLKQNMRAGIGYTTPHLGSFALDYFHTSAFKQTTRKTLTLSWSRRLVRGTYLNANFRQVHQGGTSYEGTVNFTWNFAKDRSVSAGYRHEGGTDYQTIEARQNVPFGEGTGWDVQGERFARAGSQAYSLDSSAQHNGRYGVLRGNLNLGHSETVDTQNLRLSLSGALVHLGDTFALTRPVRDSFALVSVGKAEGVRVYVNSQTAGRTNSQGRAVIPDLSSYYDNQVSIEDKDIPIDYLMPRVRLFISPPLHSGSCLNFPLRRYQAFTGTLLQDMPGEPPLDNAELILTAPDGPVDFWTGGDGEFYFDSQMAILDSGRYQGCEALKNRPGEFLPAGTYPVTVKLENETYQAQLTFPESEGETVDLGTLVCRRVEPAPSPGAESTVPAPAPPGGTTPSAEAPAATPVSVRSEENPSSAPTVLTPEAPVASPPSATVVAEESSSPVFIHFPFNRAQPLPEDLQRLQTVAKNLLSHPEWGIEIEGYTCSLGSEGYNLKLGLRRAEAVHKYLVVAGIAENRFKRVFSVGEKDPVCPGPTEECLRQNRRVVLMVVPEEY